jgi:hypothetical protein
MSLRLPLCLIEHDAMKTWGWSTFLTLALDVGGVLQAPVILPETSACIEYETGLDAEYKRLLPKQGIKSIFLGC